MPSPRVAPLLPPYPEAMARDVAQMMPPGSAPLTPFRTLAHNARLLHTLHLGNLLDRGSLSRRERELVILRTCAQCGAEYEWGVHVAFFARNVGLGDTQVRATVRGEESDPVWSEQDALLIQLADQLSETSRISDGVWEQLVQHWSAAQILELIAIVGFYHTISFLTNSVTMELEPWAARFPEGRDEEGRVLP
jgi:4-carboxymuconolactone decarboxylase